MPEFDVDSWLEENVAGSPGASLSEDWQDWSSWDWDTDSNNMEGISSILTASNWLNNDAYINDPVTNYMLNWMSGDQPESWGMGDTNTSGMVGEDLQDYTGSWPPTGEDFLTELFMQLFLHSSIEDQTQFADYENGSWQEWAGQFQNTNADTGPGGTTPPSMNFYFNQPTEGGGNTGDCGAQYGPEGTQWENELQNESWTTCVQGLTETAQWFGQQYGYSFDAIAASILDQTEITNQLSDLIGDGATGISGLIQEFNINYGDLNLDVLMANAAAKAATFQYQADQSTAQYEGAKNEISIAGESLTEEFGRARTIEGRQKSARGARGKSPSLLEGGINSSVLMNELNGLANYSLGITDTYGMQQDIFSDAFNDYMSDIFDPASSEYQIAYDELLNQIDIMIDDYNQEDVMGFVNDQENQIWDMLNLLTSQDIVPMPGSSTDNWTEYGDESTCWADDANGNPVPGVLCGDGSCAPEASMCSDFEEMGDEDLTPSDEIDEGDDVEWDPYGSMDIYGCRDSFATNYNPDATIDDGSCAYTGDEAVGDVSPGDDIVSDDMGGEPGGGEGTDQSGTTPGGVCNCADYGCNATSIPLANLFGMNCSEYCNSMGAATGCSEPTGGGTGATGGSNDPGGSGQGGGWQGGTSSNWSPSTGYGASSGNDDKLGDETNQPSEDNFCDCLSDPFQSCCDETW